MLWSLKWLRMFWYRRKHFVSYTYDIVSDGRLADSGRWMISKKARTGIMLEASPSINNGIIRISWIQSIYDICYFGAHLELSEGVIVWLSMILNEEENTRRAVNWLAYMKMRWWQGIMAKILRAWYLVRQHFRIYKFSSQFHAMKWRQLRKSSWWPLISLNATCGT